MRRAAGRGLVDALVDLGFLRETEGNFAETEHLFREAARSAGDYAMNALAMLLEQRDDLDKAEHWYRKATESWTARGSR